MKSLNLFLAASLAVSLSAPAQDLSMYQKEEFTSPDGATLRYRILYPDGYDRSKKYPLILVLHGAGERGSDNEKQLVHGSRMFLDPAVRKKFPAIVVFPQCPEESYWSSVQIDREKTPLQLDFDYSRPITAPLSLTMKLLNDLVEKERVDSRRIYITGLSMGGMGTFEAVHRYPRTFAAALPICGGGDTIRYQRTETPFWVFHGDADNVVDVKYSRAMVRCLEVLDVKTKYTEYPGVMHNSWDSAFAEPRFLKWMFAKRQKK